VEGAGAAGVRIVVVKPMVASGRLTLALLGFAGECKLRHRYRVSIRLIERTGG
jgi:hypothetical protein